MNKRIKNDFINAMAEKRLISVTWHSTNQGILTRTLAPLDFGPSMRSSSPEPRYHCYSSTDTSKHPVSLRPEQIIAIEILEERFSPANIVN